MRVLRKQSFHRLRMVGHGTRVGIDDQIMLHARQLEIADELGARVRMRGRRRDHFHDDHRVGKPSFPSQQWRSKPDGSIRLVGRVGVGRDRHAVGEGFGLYDLVPA